MDWVGTWFSIAERLGEFTDGTFGKINPDGSVQWRILPHTQYDGMAAMNFLLNTAEQGQPPKKVLRESRRPGVWALIKAFVANSWRFRSYRTAWREYDPKKTGRPLAVSWVCYGVAHSESLNRRARADGVSLNSLLLLALDRATRVTLVKGGDTCWIIPVNMRGAVGLGDEIPNQSASVQVFCTGDISLKQLHARIKERFLRHNHWVSWYLLNIGRLLGIKRTERLFAKSYVDPKPLTGTLSNVGEWESKSMNPEEAWLAVPPTFKTSPVSAAAVTTNGQLALALQLHPSLNQSAEKALELMNAWTRAITDFGGVGAPNKSAFTPREFID